ncbi:MAG: peptidase M20, partial [Thermoanaerobaculia bacterium]|nr:peptidase M20 [Thermoanaerobaculia bacterium]
MKTEKLTREALTAYAAENREAFEALLKDFVEIPSVSVDPTKKNAIRESAKLAADVIRRFGGTSRILETDGHPIVAGAWGKNPLWPTVTVY